jgi:hypothetical protein
MSLLTATNALRLIGLIALGMLYPMPAHAGEVVSCENCANPRQAAIASGIGLAVVADVSGRKLLAFDVEYDRELHRYRALPVAIPDEVNATFHRLLRLMEAARESPGDAAAFFFAVAQLP